MAVLLVLAVSGCKSQNEEKQEAVVPAEPTPVPAEYLGSYHEEIAGRGMLELKENEVIIDWSDSAFEKEHFEFSVSYKAEDNTMSYSGGKRIRITFESEEKSSEEEIYADGSGYFEIGDKKLIWHDDKAESGAEPTVFVKDEAMIGIPNPWTYTENLDEAIKADKIILMNDGKITREGTPAEIFTDRSITDLFKADLPCGVELAIRLRESGIDIPDDVITEEQLADHLVAMHQKQVQDSTGR